MHGIKNLNSYIGVQFNGTVSVSKTAGPGSNPGTPAKASEEFQMLFYVIGNSNRISYYIKKASPAS